MGGESGHGLPARYTGGRTSGLPPTPVSDPERRFVLTRLDGGIETNVAISTLLPDGYTSDQAVRATTYATARSLRDANPGVVYILYGPTNGGAHTDDDRIWRSDIPE